MIRPNRRLSRMVVGVVLAVGAWSAAAQQTVPEPEPYEPTEFGPALRALRRGEIIAIGAYPLALLATRFVYDYGRWGFEGFVAADAPFLRPLGLDPFPEEGDRIAIAVSAAAVSVTLAVVDYFLGRRQRLLQEAGPDG